MIPSRLAKLERIRQRGFDPYPHCYRRSHSASEAITLYKQLISPPVLKTTTKVSLAGRLVSNRSMGKVTFSHIQDGSGRIQIYLREELVGEENYAYYKDFDLGDFIGVEGPLFQTKTGEITLEVHQFAMLAKSLHPLPEKWHGLVDVEKRFRQRYLDLIASEKSRQTFVLRSKVLSSIRKYMDSRGFLEVETPVLQPIYGGAMAKPFITYYNALDMNMYLRVATELYLKRLIIGGFERVYEIGKDFRNEGLSTRHNPEFTMMESYEAYADYSDVMRMVEEMIVFVAQEVLGSDRVTYQGMELDLNPPWQRITIKDALQQFVGIEIEPSMDGNSLATQAAAKGMEIDPEMGEAKIIDLLISDFVAPNLFQPTFLIDYPVELSPLAKRKPDNPMLVERFEPYMAGLELGNAFSELNDPMDQRERFLEQARARELGDEEAQPMDEDFLLALEHGMPPTGGLGLGIDRLVMILADQPSIREVLLFPQLRTKN